jgi:predicted nucleotidyltransferase
VSPAPDLPPEIERLVDDLALMPGVTSVVLGGSRAEGIFDPTSDWDIGVYYRAPLDLSRLRAYGEVHPPGAWGRLMNGGAWLIVDGHEVDVVLRDADVVEAWTAQAERGEFEVEGLLGYAAGAPTYLVAAERHAARVLRGEAPRRIELPALLAETATRRWRFCSAFSLEQAHARAKRGDVVGAAGQAARAIVEEAHARLCARREWVLNEKRILQRAGLSEVQRIFAGVPEAPGALTDWVGRIGQILARGAETS